MEMEPTHGEMGICTRVNSLKTSVKEKGSSPLRMAMYMRGSSPMGYSKAKESTPLSMVSTEVAGRAANTTELAFSNSKMDRPTVVHLWKVSPTVKESKNLLPGRLRQVFGIK